MSLTHQSAASGSIVATLPVMAYFDGLCEPNPGGTCCGGWRIEPAPGVPGLEQEASGCRHYGSGRSMTRNTAEYYAGIDALGAIYRTGYRGAVHLRCDCRLVVNQFCGAWECTAPRLANLLVHLRRAAGYFSCVTMEWIPSEENAQADALSRRAYREVIEASRGRP
jgi:ribonuclease HI